MALLIPELPLCSPFELAAAVRRTIEDGSQSTAARSLDGRLPSSRELREAGREVVVGEGVDENTRALALLEAPYLVAASDGLEPQERQALSALIAHLVGSAAPDAVCEVLDWFDERLRSDGPEVRMAKIAQSFDTRAEREQVLGFATLLALADRRLALTEQNTLVRLGEVLGFKRAEIQMLIHKISLRLERAMAVSIRPPASEPDGPAREDEDAHAASPTSTSAREGETRGGSAADEGQGPAAEANEVPRVPPTERSG